MIIEPNSSMRPAVGAIVTRPKGFATHSAIYMGQNTAFENVPGGARFVSWYEFANGQTVTVCETLNIPYSELWRRAQAIVAAKRQYHLVDFNCDDAVNLVAGEVVRPSQLVMGLCAIVFIVGAVSLFAGEV
jgi:hypothetical protein